MQLTVKPLSLEALGNRHSRSGGEEPREDEATSELHCDTGKKVSEGDSDPMMKIKGVSWMSLEDLCLLKSGQCSPHNS